MAIKKIISILCAAVLMAGFTACSKNPEEAPKRTMTNAPVFDRVALPQSLWQAPEYYFDAEKDRSEADIKALFYKTYYDNLETYAFAYIGIPAGASKDNKAPAVLLVHGGAGTAYWEWVKMWTDKGYVALAMDLEGHIPTEEGVMTSPHTELYTKSEYAAPTNHNYNDSNLQLEKTWMYYAVQTAILGNSLLHSLDYVDNYKIGVCGVSWGGVITSIITGYDDRFAFSIPIYCSLNMEGTNGFVPSYYTTNPAALIWDDPRGLANVKTPICFVVSNSDAACSIESIAKCYDGAKNGRLVIYDGLLHSQFIAASLLEPYDFADNIIKNQGKLITFKEQPSKDKQYCKINIPQGSSADVVKLYYTSEEEISSNTNWGRRNCQLLNDTITFTLDSTTTAFYITVEDEQGIKVTSKIVMI